MINHSMKFFWAIHCVICLHCVSLAFAIGNNHQVLLNNEPEQEPHRVAIIGAGAAGSSAAYHLLFFSQWFPENIPVNITIFETNSRIGGRTTTVNALDDDRYPTELGASIFVEINHILYNATRDWDLKVKSKHCESSSNSDYDLGVWDGSQFVFKQSTGSDSVFAGWWNIAKLLWKYGMSPIWTQRITKSTVGRFLKFYDEPIFPFSTLQQAVDETGLLDFTGVTGEAALKAAGVGELFSREIIQASTRVNYAQNLNRIHGLEALVCMAIEGAMAVEGGNWQIFDTLVKHSRAAVNLKTTVARVEETNKGKYQLHTTSASNEQHIEPFDSVILAAPYQFANVIFTPPLVNPPKEVPYVSLHVTLLTTPYLLSAKFFDLSSQSEVPSTILTTLPEGMQSTIDSSSFWSISTLRILPPSPDSPLPQYLYKIFSPSRITGTFLSSLFDFPYQNATSEDPITAIPETDISWSHEKTWNSYPYEIPRMEFEDNIRLYTEKKTVEQQEKKADGGIWYTSGIESFISTMETSALSGRNVARLIIGDLRRRRKGKGYLEKIL